MAVAPGNVGAVAGQAFLTRRLGNFEEADAYIRQAKAMNPDSLQGHGFAAAIAQFKGDTDAAFDAFTPLASYDPYTYAAYALATEDENKVRAAFAVWPASQRSTPTQKAGYALAQLRSADLLSLSASDREMFLATLRALYDPSAGWKDSPYSHPALIAAFLGETETVDRLAAEYPPIAKDDAVDAISGYSDLAESYLRLGQPDRALDYLEKMTQITGPYIQRVFESDPLFVSLKSNPRWSELAEYKG